MPTKVLVVEDERDLELLISLKFRRRIRAGELQFFFAANGVEALKILESHADIYVVTSDIRMPEMDGFEAASRILRFDKSVVIVAFTADNMPETKKKAGLIGINDFISKPVRIEDLKQLLARHFKK